MKIVIAVDSFKGSINSIEAGSAVAEGIQSVNPLVETVVCPIADGGEGTVEALTRGMGGSVRKIMVTGPLLQPVEAFYGILPGGIAVIEIAAAAGLSLVPQKDRNPYFTTTYGVGELIRDAINQECRHFIVGIGGSATNDGGAGMLQALGVRLTDKSGKEIRPGAIGLSNLVAIHREEILPELEECSFRIACDVDNPLCGSNGASAVFGPQKGATKDQIEDLDAWLHNFAKLVEMDDNVPGAGAAGGLGYAFSSFLHGKLESGISIVLEEIQLEKQMKDADLVVTGEGRLDGQTAMGKAPAGVAALAKKYEVPVVALAGGVTPSAKILHEKGITALFPVIQEITTLETAMEQQVARKNIKRTAEEVFRLFHINH